ncbi:sulfatase family protein [Haloarcula marina]|uniref:sulfatase family protein n=1 Tax=Haloarcula marina TaxID=2961574 RepID=UPI0020B8426D|nr:sulfatase [Halomicroarcula marina]
MPDKQPNVLFTFSDQHRAQALGCYGNDDVISPNFDRLASEGTRYANACANDPVCGPSRGSLITGQYPTTHGVVRNDVQLPRDVPSVAEAFQEAGYRTGYIGKWHLDGVPRDKFTPPGPRRHGFNDFWAVLNCTHDYMDAAYYRDDEDELVEVDGYEPFTQTDLAIEFIEADDKRPFCLFLAWGPPHDPYRMVPKEYRERYDAEELTVRPNVEPIMPSHPDHPGGSYTSAPPIREFALEGDVYDEPVPYEYDGVREGLVDYYAHVSALDEQFGRLLDALEDVGCEDNTVVAYSSDHGDSFWSQGLNQKGTPFAESINVPLIVRWPDEVPAGQVSRSPVGTVDISPTLLGLADVSVPDAMEGIDCSESMTNRHVDGPDAALLTSAEAGWRGLRTKRYTYARVTEEFMQEHAPVQGPEWLLFDNENDLYQFRNRVYDPEYRDVVEALDERLLSRLDDIGDPFYPKVEMYYEELGIESQIEEIRNWRPSLFD